MISIPILMHVELCFYLVVEFSNVAAIRGRDCVLLKNITECFFEKRSAFCYCAIVVFFRDILKRTCGDIFDIVLSYKIKSGSFYCHDCIDWLDVIAAGNAYQFVLPKE